MLPQRRDPAHSSRSAEPPGDAGFTLTELLVTVVVGGIVLVMIGSFLVSSMQADRQVRGLNDATSRGELALDTLRTVLHSAATPMAIGAGTASGDLVLRAKVAATGSGPVVWDCVAFYFDAARGELRSQRNAGTATTPAVRVADPDASTLAGWPIVAAGLLPPETGEVFALRDRDPGPGYEADPGALEVHFRADAGSLGAPAFGTAIVARSQSHGGATCAP